MKVCCIINRNDFEQKQQMKYKEPTKGKGMRTLFRKAGFQTYLVDEFSFLRSELGVWRSIWK